MVLLEKNLSIASVIMIVTLIILFTSGCRGKHIAFLFSVIGVAGVAFTIFEPYRLARFTSFLNPWADPKGKGYQLIQSLLDRKSTRLNSSHANISYAVFCLKKKNTLTNQPSVGKVDCALGSLAYLEEMRTRRALHHADEDPL